MGSSYATGPTYRQDSSYATGSTYGHGDAAPGSLRPWPGTVRRAPLQVGQISLVNITCYKVSDYVAYDLRLEAPWGEGWTVTRRYREFDNCHTELAAEFGHHQLPRLPPKEPVWQQIFGEKRIRTEWADERIRGLQAYIRHLLTLPGVLQCDTFVDFLGVPIQVHTEDFARHDTHDSNEDLL